MKSAAEFILSLVLIVGWFISAIGIIGLIVSIIAKGLFIIVQFTITAVGLLLIWIYKKVS
ncbi:hypothetical protein LC040_03055 [Bacillus tianshenii]|nr:hypothetical protein LC040_03055 [Bacillus tianshenii]